MPNTTFDFQRFNFTNSSPDWATDTEYSSNMRFQTVSKTLVLDNTNYGRGVYTVSVNTGDYDYGSIHFSTSNQSVLSVSEESINELHLLGNYPGSPVSFIFKDAVIPFSTKTFYVISNGDPEISTGTITISIALGNNDNIPNVNPVVDFEFTCPININEYTVGLHTSSPFGAKASTSTLTTKLYSTVAIENWGVDTKIFSSPYFANPALPYYYGYNGKVYQVGDDWSRSFGIKYEIEVRVKKRLFRSDKVTNKTNTIGPLETLNLNGGSPLSSACIEPIMGNIGKIRRVFDDDSILDEPEQYEYYLGYDQNNKRNSNDSVFNKWHYGRKRAYGILGWQHALQKFTLGITTGYNTEFGGVNWNILAGAAGMGSLAALFPATASIVLESVSTWWVGTALNGFLTNVFGTLFGPGTTALLSNPWTFVVAAVVALIWSLFTYFKTKTYIFKEDCSSFLHHFSDGEYINIGDELFRQENLHPSSRNPGYYCDGVYFYHQTNGTITNKELSFTNALVDEDPLTINFGYSLPADNPTLVEDFTALVLLPYCSGKPVPYCGLGNTVYYSGQRTHTVTPQCCELEDCSEPIVLTLPYGAVTSCLSTNDANNKAQIQFQASIDYAETHGVYSNTLEDELIGVFTTNFTHEIKQETTPTEVDLYFDIRSGSNAPINTPLFYDFTGCQKALPGYYAISSSNYPKTYYKVENGEVAKIEVQQNAGSTTTTPSGLPIVTDNLNYQSNWYLNNTNYQPLQTTITNTNDRTFDVNSYLSSSPFRLTAGIVIPITHTNFLRYNSFNTSGITTSSKTEQPSAWYAELNDWKPEADSYFEYQSSLSTFRGSLLSPTTPQSTGSICSQPLSSTDNYYFNGEGNLPSTGDRIYNSDNSNNPTGNGLIKYSDNNYLYIEGGSVKELFSCNAELTFVGSIYTTSSLDNLPEFIAYEYSSTNGLPPPVVSNEITYPGTNDNPSNNSFPNLESGFIKDDNLTYQLDDNGIIINSINNSKIGYWQVPTNDPSLQGDFGMDTISFSYNNAYVQGYVGQNSPSNFTAMGGVDKPFFKGDGWFVTQLTWNAYLSVPGEAELHFYIRNEYAYDHTGNNNSYNPIISGMYLRIEDYAGVIQYYYFGDITPVATQTGNARTIKYIWTPNVPNNPFGGATSSGTLRNASVRLELPAQ